MVLLLTAIDQKGQVREFTCHIPSLEVAFDILSRITATGDSLTQASILDQGHLTHLPIDAFDGSIFLAPIQDLESQWQAILDESPGSTAPNFPELLQWTRRQVQQYERHISTLENMISRFRQLRQRAEDYAPPSQLTTSGVVDHFASMINRYESQRDKAQILHEAALERLSRLIA